jgi:predicted ribosome quality control (RQC) complex YloA/Tae2 family protein
MKEGVTSLDLMFLIKELKDKLVGSKIQAIKQIGKTFIFELYKEERFFLKIILPHAIYTTKLSKQAPETPPDFCMLLRKYLLNKIVSDVRQHEFDRIVELDVDGNHLIIELFSTGNLVLTNPEKIIIGLFEQQEWKDRILKPKALYKYPPSNLNPFKYDFLEFQKILKQINKDVVRGLAVDFGFGGMYAEEFCKKLGIDKNKPLAHLEQTEIDVLYRFIEQLKNFVVQPSVILENKKQVDVTPFDLSIHTDKEKIEFTSFNKAVEAYFEGVEKMKKEDEEIKKQVVEQEKLKRILEQQTKQLKLLREKEQKYRTIAQLLYERYHVFNEILNGLNKLKQEGKSWEEIKEIIKTQETEESRLIKSIKEDEAKIIVVIDGTEIELDFRKSVEDNANYFFEEAKRLKDKIEAVQQATKKFEVKPVEKPTEVEKPKVKKRWYERYRWFISSNGILVIAGKNARNNETIIKRYTRPQDLVLHADIHGSPFAVIRNDQRLEVLPAETIYEAAELVATYSKAWDEKISQVSVYYVNPSQVVKEGGLPIGSFVIKGERRWLEKIKPRLSIGIKQEEVYNAKLIYGPPTAVKKQTPYLVTIVPGDKPADELAKEIKLLLVSKVPYEIRSTTDNIGLEEIKKLIPYGKGELVR